MAEAPSEICEELPAVTVPPWGLKAACQALQGSVRADGFVPLHQGQGAGFVVALDRNDFARELALLGGLVGELV